MRAAAVPLVACAGNAYYHACCDVAETRPHGRLMIVSHSRLLSSTNCTMAVMPRATKGIGRTGSKHKKKAAAGPEAQSTISEGVSGPPSNPVPQKTATAVDQVAAQAGPAEDDLVECFRRLRPPDPSEPCDHPRYADPSWNGFEKVGYRGCGHAYGDEKWDRCSPCSSLAMTFGDRRGR